MTYTIAPTGFNPTPRLHPVRHVGPCGARLASPHPRCQELTAPYNAAELVRAHLTSAAVRVNVVMIRCHGCGSVWQGSEATA